MFLNNFLETKQREPLFNVMDRALELPAFKDFSQIGRKNRMMTLASRSAEVMSIVRGVAGDVVGKFHFEPVVPNSRDSGRNKLLKATTFAEANRFKKLLRDMVIDILITGEAYMWKATLPEEERKQIQKVISTKSKEFKQLFDEDLSAPRQLRHMASTSMIIRYDRHNVLGYTQRVGTTEIDFDLKETVRLNFEELNGRPEGWTPLYSLPLQIQLLWLLWQNQFYKQAKGNHPDLVVSLEGNGVNANHPSFKRIEQALRSYNTPGNSTHGSLLLSGEKISIDQLKRDDTMEFRDVGMLISSLVASQWQYPASRMSLKTVEATATKDSGGNADRGYWLNIEQMQDTIDDVMNTQLWIPFFGVRMVHDKAYLHDEVVEGTAEQLRLGNISTRVNMLRQSGKSLTPEAMVNLINNKSYMFTESDLVDTDADIPDMAQMGSIRNINKDEALSREKRRQELDREQNTGTPTGV